MSVFNKMIFLDLETDSLNLDTAQITQIALVGVINDVIVDTLEIKIKFDDTKGNQEALAKGHYDPEVWAKEAVDFKTAADMIDNFQRKYKWVRREKKNKPGTYATCMMGGHNIFKFDGPILRRHYKEYDKFCPFDFTVGYDSLASMQNYCAKAGMVYRSIGMEALCEMFDVQNKLPHHALYDAMANVEVALKIHEMEVEYYGPQYVAPVIEEKNIVVPDVIDI